MTKGHESDHEQATIERLQLLGYKYLPGLEIDRSLSVVEKHYNIRCKMADKASISYSGIVQSRGEKTPDERIG